MIAFWIIVAVILGIVGNSQSRLGSKEALVKARNERANRVARFLARIAAVPALFGIPVLLLYGPIHDDGTGWEKLAYIARIYLSIGIGMFIAYRLATWGNE